MGNGHLIGYTPSLTTLQQCEWNGAINQPHGMMVTVPGEFYKNQTGNGKGQEKKASHSHAQRLTQ